MGAALVIGWRQAAIQGRQVELQDAQLRSELFDRRYSVFDRVEQFVREILQRAADPDPATQREFLLAMGESRFLFANAVEVGIKAIWDKWADFHSLKAVMDHTYRTQGHYGDGNPQRESDALAWFGNQLTELPTLFQELKLTTPAA